MPFRVQLHAVQRKQGDATKAFSAIKFEHELEPLGGDFSRFHDRLSPLSTGNILPPVTLGRFTKFPKIGTLRP
jgi:hypothetical protein